MRTISIDGKEYVLEYSFAAAEHRETVQKMFNVVSGAYLVKDATFDSKEENEDKKNNTVATMINGVSEMVADIPHIVKTAFYSGLLEHQPNIKEDEAYQLMKAYMKANKISFNKLFEDIKTCMEDDGFFDLSGLTEMMENMKKSMEAAQAEKADKKVPTKRTAKKQTSTK